MFHQDATATPSTLRPTVRISNLLIQNFHMHEATSAMSDTQDVDSRTPLLKQSVPRPGSLSRKISLLLQDWWLWEILSALTALISSTAIIVILIIFDSSSLPDWPSVFTVRCILPLQSHRKAERTNQDQFYHFFLCRDHKTCHHLGYRGFDLTV